MTFPPIRGTVRFEENQTLPFRNETIEFVIAADTW